MAVVGIILHHERDKAAELEKNGAKVAGSIAEACKGREVVISMVSDDKALTDVVKEISGALEKGAIHVAMGTHGVHALREVDAVHGKLGQKFIASPVLGRPEAAAAGGPLLEVHVVTAPRAQGEPDGEGEERDDDEERDVHRRSPRSRPWM